MNRAVFNLFIDAVAGALLTALVGAGYILWFALPPGTNRTHSLWGLLRHQYGALHFWISLTLLAALSIHVALHWRWLVTGLCKRFGAGPWAQRRPRAAALALLAVAAAPLAVIAVSAQVSVRPLDRPLHPPEGERRRADEAIPTAPDPADSRAIVAAAAKRDRAAAVLAARCASCHDAVKPAGGVRANTPAALLAHSPKHRITEERRSAAGVGLVRSPVSELQGWSPDDPVYERTRPRRKCCAPVASVLVLTAATRRIPYPLSPAA